MYKMKYMLNEIKHFKIKKDLVAFLGLIVDLWSCVCV